MARMGSGRCSSGAFGNGRVAAADAVEERPAAGRADEPEALLRDCWVPFPAGEVRVAILATLPEGCRVSADFGSEALGVGRLEA